MKKQLSKITFFGAPESTKILQCLFFLDKFFFLLRSTTVVTVSSSFGTFVKSLGGKISSGIKKSNS